MTWSIVGVSAVVETITTTHTLTEPAGVAAGDLLVACIASRIASTTAVTIPAGWTRATDQKINNIVLGTTGQASACIAWIIRGASAPALGFTHPATPNVARGQIVAYRENTVGGAISFDTFSTAATATAITAISIASSVTTTFANDLLVGMVAGGSAATYSAFKTANAPSTASGATNTSSTPSTTTWTERADASSATGADVGLSVFDAVKTATGAGGAITATASVSSGHSVLMAAFKTSVPTADAWNVHDISANITLSASDKTATLTSATTAGARSTTTHPNETAGKYYAEFAIGSTVPTQCGILPTSTFPASSTTGGARADLVSGTMTVFTTTVGSFSSAFAAGDILSVAWDAGAEAIWFRKNAESWNNSGSADPATGTGGFSYSAAAATEHALWLRSVVSGSSVTLRTELAEYTQTVPSGFTSWMGETPAGGGISVPVTGVQATGAVDQVTVTGKANVSTTGLAASGSVGSVTVAAATSISVPVTGVAATGAVGTVTVSTVTRVDVAAPVTGVEATGSVGSVAITGKASTTITGVQATGAVGTVTATAGAGVSVPVTGVQGAGAVGAATASGKAVATVTGVATTGAVGSVTVTAGTGVAVPVTGVAAAGSVDAVTITGKANVPVTGVAAAGAIGGVSVVAGGSISTTVTGVQATGQVGSVAVITEADVPVTGVQAIASVGSVTVTAAELAGLVSVWNGSAWVDKPAKVWSGSAWQQKPVKHWTGSAWV